MVTKAQVLAWMLVHVTCAPGKAQGGTPLTGRGRTSYDACTGEGPSNPPQFVQTNTGMTGNALESEPTYVAPAHAPWSVVPHAGGDEFGLSTAKKGEAEYYSWNCHSATDTALWLFSRVMHQRANEMRGRNRSAKDAIPTFMALQGTRRRKPITKVLLDSFVRSTMTSGTLRHQIAQANQLVF